MRFLIVISALFFSINVGANIVEQRPDGVDDKKWNSLKAAVQEAKLLPEPAGIGGQNTYFGSKVDINGNWAMVTTNLPNYPVWVYQNINGNWTKTQEIAEEFDQSIRDISINGSTAAIAKGNQVLIFEFSSGSWVKSQTIYRNSYSLSLENTFLLIGCHFCNKAYVYEFQTGDWNLQQELVGNDTSNGDAFGISVSLSGSRAVIGSSNHDANGLQDSGAAYIFDFDGNSWNQTEKIIPSDSEINNRFGYFVNLLGNRALFSSWYDDDNGASSGSAYVFDFDGADWNQTQKIFSSDIVAGLQFGISIDQDSNNLFISSRNSRDINNQQTGAIFRFELSGNTWMETQKIIPNDSMQGDSFGNNIAISNNFLISGAEYDDINFQNDNEGSFYLYEGVANSFVQTDKFSTGLDGSAYDNFGAQVSIDGNFAAIGVSRDDDNGIDRGAVYLYVFDGTSWNFSQKISNPFASGGTNNYFGSSVIIKGNSLFISATRNFLFRGAVYLYEYDGSSWQYQQLMVASDGFSGDYFGEDMALSNNRLIIGAWQDDDNGLQSGSAYIFENNGSSWIQTAKLIASDGAGNNFFGRSVAIDNNRAVVGASGRNQVYIYDYNGSVWQETHILSPLNANNTFGFDLGIESNRIIASSSSGSYVFDFNGSVWSESHFFQFQGYNSVDIQGDILALGRNGQVDTYYYISGEWYNTDRYLNHNHNEGLGQSVTLSSPRVIIGAPNNSEHGRSAGAAYIYDYTDNFVLGGTVSNLSGSGLVLSNNSEVRNINQDSVFSFGFIDDLTTYDVIVTTQPSNPSQICTISNGNGTIQGNHVVNVMVNCVDAYDVNVTVNGLAAGNSVDVSNGGVTNVVTDITSTTTFTLDDGSAYAVTTTNATTPNQTCSVTGGTNGDGSGTLNGADVAIMITCVTNTYDLNVTVNGLAAGNSVDVSNGGVTNAVSDVSNTTSFNLDDGSAYVVTTTNATTPNQNCSVTGGDNGDGSGTLSGSDVEITINCVTNTYDVNITVTGLAETNTVSFGNGSDEATFMTDETQTLSILDDGSAYSVSITSAQPDTPNQVCSFSDANTGTLNGTDVTITVECVTSQYSIGGSVTGLADGNQVVLQNNLGDDLTVSDNESFEFSLSLDDETAYSVSVKTNPTSPNQTCSISNGNGVLAGMDVSDVEVNCTLDTYFVGGSLSGLITGNSITLQNNESDDLVLTEDGAFVFVTPVLDQAGYTVTISADAINPVQPCQVNNASGVIDGDDVTDVSVLCEFGNDLIYKDGFEQVLIE